MVNAPRRHVTCLPLMTLSQSGKQACKERWNRKRGALLFALCQKSRESKDKRVGAASLARAKNSIRTRTRAPNPAQPSEQRATSQPSERAERERRKGRRAESSDRPPSPLAPLALAACDRVAIAPPPTSCFQLTQTPLEYSLHTVASVAVCSCVANRALMPCWMRNCKSYSSSSSLKINAIGIGHLINLMNIYRRVAA